GVIDLDRKAKDEAFGRKIRALMEEKELFRLPQFTLQDLTVQMNSNRSYVSARINSHFGCNFKQLLNSYRMEAAKDLLRHPDLDMREIVDKVGFNSYSSFYRAFNASEGCSPKEWREKYKNSVEN
ncbi:MAG: AraC family transcriptional regulator, partial [Tannerellaceae bacterium]|nr:AraC family transcriptional regulator [Tannerellaceae bacterium]